MARTLIDNSAPEDGATEIVKHTARFNPEQLREIATFEDAVALAAETYGGVVSASEELGDGFALIKDEDKDQFVKVNGGMLFLSWTFSPGDFGSEMVTARVMTKGGKFIINDGSTGIRAQLREYTNRTGRDGGLFSARGLRKSSYGVDSQGNVVPENDPRAEKKGATYYIDTAA